MSDWHSEGWMEVGGGADGEEVVLRSSTFTAALQQAKDSAATQQTHTHIHTHKQCLRKSSFSKFNSLLLPVPY